MPGDIICRRGDERQDLILITRGIVIIMDSFHADKEGMVAYWCYVPWPLGAWVGSSPTYLHQIRYTHDNVHCSSATTSCGGFLRSSFSCCWLRDHSNHDHAHR